MGIFKWRGRVSKSELRRHFVETLRDVSPQLECTLSDDDDPEVTVAGMPMDATPRSIFRLFRKLAGHLDYKDTAEYLEQCGDGTTDIEVCIHPDSDAAVFDLLAALPDFVERRGARLAVKHLE